MKINGVDISVFNGKQLKVDIQTSSIEINKEWLKKALIPLTLSSKVSYKQIKLEILFKGNSRDEILKNISNLTAKLKKETELILDGYSNKYIAALSNKSTEKTISKFRYLLKLEFEGYEVGNQVTEAANRVSTKTINIPGNSETPAIVEITPSATLVDLVVTGLGETFTLKNLAVGQKIIVNGEDCTVLQGSTNRFSDYDSWDFPVLYPGANTITFSKSSCDVSIKYKPRWI